MQQFVVPQFIDVEDKIIGSVTVRQFLIMLVGGLLIFISYRLADFVLFVILTLVIGGLSLVFAFGRYNGQNFHYVLLNVVQYIRRPYLRIWQKKYDRQELEYLRKYGMEKEAVETEVKKKQAKHQHIGDLSLIVNTGGYYRGDNL